MEVEKGDIVETTYTNITNKVGEIVAIYDNAVTIVGMLGEESHHKKSRLKKVENEKSSAIKRPANPPRIPTKPGISGTPKLR